MYVYHLAELVAIRGKSLKIQLKELSRVLALCNNRRLDPVRLGNARPAESQACRGNS
jgi:hypothetical protein